MSAFKATVVTSKATVVASKATVVASTYTRYFDNPRTLVLGTQVVKLFLLNAEGLQEKISVFYLLRRLRYAFNEAVIFSREEGGFPAYFQL